MTLDPAVYAALQRQLERRAAALATGARHVGWKVGAGIEELGEPVFGYLTSASVVPDGGAYEGATLHAETELLIAGERLGVALELVDTTRPPGGMPTIVEENVFHRAVVLGEPLAAEPGAEARLYVDGEPLARAPVDVDVAAVRARLAAQLEALGERLRSDDRVLAGSLTHVPVAPGQKVCAEIDGLGRVTVAIV